jgi:putative nucleotidyltransferase with HDIG domain
MIQKIETSGLEFGMYVVRLDRAWLETPFIFHRFHIDEQQQIEQLREYCDFVYIDPEMSKESANTPKIEQTEDQISNEIKNLEAQGSVEHMANSWANASLGWESKHRAQKAADIGKEPSSIGDEIHRAIKIQEQAKRTVSRILTEVRMGMSISTSEARETVSLVVDSVLRNSNALICLSQLRGRDEYTCRHSLNVCTLSVAFGRFLGLEKERLQVLGMGGMLHDIGKMKVSLAILNKPGKLTGPEFDEIKKHVEYGLAVLSKAKGVPDESLPVIAEHHERTSGSGYPKRLDESQISLFGAIAAIVDVYDAITTDRVYHPHLTPHEALRSMFQWGNRDFRMELLERFIRCMGIYPAGSLVQVNHAQVAVVLSANPLQALKPTILLIRDECGIEYPSPLMIDLAADGMERLKITDVLDPAVERINIKTILGDRFLL